MATSHFSLHLAFRREQYLFLSLVPKNISRTQTQSLLPWSLEKRPDAPLTLRCSNPHPLQLPRITKTKVWPVPIIQNTSAGWVEPTMTLLVRNAPSREMSEKKRTQMGTHMYACVRALIRTRVCAHTLRTYIDKRVYSYTSTLIYIILF